MNIYLYAWYLDDNDGKTIRAYGITREGNTVCCSINDYNPFIYLELTKQKETKQNFNKVFSAIKKIMGDNGPVSDKTKVVSKKVLYGGSVRHYLLMYFELKMHIYMLRKKLKSISEDKFRNSNLSLEELKILKGLIMHESTISPILQLCTSINISLTGWAAINVRPPPLGLRPPRPTNPALSTLRSSLPSSSYTDCDFEYNISYTDLKSSPLEISNIVPNIKIMSWDIEANSSDINKFPTGKHPDDKVFQISAVVKNLEDGETTNYLLSLKTPIVEDCILLLYDTEANLLKGFASLLKTLKPQITIGWNIFQFDFEFLLKRAKFNNCLPSFLLQGYPKEAPGKEKIIKWDSKAYGSTCTTFVESEGIIHIDLMNVIQKGGYRLDNYKLDTVAYHVLGENKLDLPAVKMFEYFRMGDDISMGEIGKYCIQDSALVLKLFDELKIWFDLSEMAKTCFITISIVHLQGQQIRFFHQMYRYCFNNNILITIPEPTAESEAYSGAYCYPPNIGIYKNVIPLDFASLYPSIIIAYNIDYTTFAPDAPDDKCNVFTWEDHIGCEHDTKIIKKIEITKLLEASGKKLTIAERKKLIIERADIAKTITKQIICKKRRFKFLKEPLGALPTIIQNLLEARKRIRKQMETIEDPFVLNILDKQQNACKITANSMYGATGAEKGYLPFIPIAMCVTYLGRKNIQKVSELLSSKGMKIVYGDTDSNYVTFERDLPVHELWNNAIQVAKDVSAAFPPPLCLEFEKAIYTQFLLLAKKKYMYTSCGVDGKVRRCPSGQLEIGKRGVVLVRRDNCKFIKNLYSLVIKLIFEGENEHPADGPSVSKERVLNAIIDNCVSLYSRETEYSDLVITKSINDYGDDELVPIVFENNKGIAKGKLGNYTVPLHPSDKPENELPPKVGCTALLGPGTPGCARRPIERGLWYKTKLPAQVQLELKIKQRGHKRDEGSRISYVVCDIGVKSKQFQKIESFSYFLENSSILKIDYGYYIERLIQPMDQVLKAVWGIDNFVKDLHKVFCKKNNMIKELNNKTKSKINLVINK